MVMATPNNEPKMAAPRRPNENATALKDAAGSGQQASQLRNVVVVTVVVVVLSDAR